MKRLGVLVGVGVALGISGCGLDPFLADTVPTIESQDMRISEGAGSTNAYSAAVEVTPGNVVQVRTLIADGKQVAISMPRGPATEIDVTASGDGDQAITTLLSATGEPFEVDGMFEFDPGYMGVEDRSDADTLAIRISTPRLTGAGQGQVRFRFKTRVR